MQSGGRTTLGGRFIVARGTLVQWCRQGRRVVAAGREAGWGWCRRVQGGSGYKAGSWQLVPAQGWLHALG